MEISTRELIEGSIVKRVEEIDSLEPGSKERSLAMEDLSKVLHAINEDDRNENERAIKQDQLLEQKKSRELDQWFKRGTLIIGGINVAGLFYEIFSQNGAVRRGMKFEETGTITSSFVRKSIDSLLRKHDFRNKKI